MDYLITFLEGIITFVSPCLLPMLPVYIAYFAGGTLASDGPGGDGVVPDTASADDEQARLRRTLICALGFVLGFTVLFTLLGALTATVGGFSARIRPFSMPCAASSSSFSDSTTWAC